MTGALIPAATRVMLDRRIAEEGMLALDPPFSEPVWSHALHGFSFIPNAFTMGADGRVPGRWVHADEVDWLRTVAARFETPWGAPIAIDRADEDEDYC